MAARKVYAIVILSTMMLAGCGGRGNNKVVLSIGGEKMTVPQVEERLRQAPGGLQSYLATPAGKKQFIDLLVRERTLIASAKNAGYDKRKDYKDMMSAFEK